MKKIKLLNLFLTLYFLIAVGALFYNGIKTYFEIKEWYFLSDTQKRHHLFGDIYDFFAYINKHTPPKSSILIVSKDVRTFFLGRYYLYPRKLQVVTSEAEVGKQTFLPEYVSSYKIPIHITGYSLIGTIILKDSKTSGFLYKKK